MQEIEGLYTVYFGLPPYVSGGVIVLETMRFFGGDSVFYYVGNFSITGNQISANGKVTAHSPAPNVATVFGDFAREFDVELMGVVKEGRIEGLMSRPEMPGFVLPVLLSYKERLP